VRRKTLSLVFPVSDIEPQRHRQGKEENGSSYEINYTGRNRPMEEPHCKILEITVRKICPAHISQYPKMPVG